MSMPSNADLQRQITALSVESRLMQGETVKKLDKISDKLDSAMEKLSSHDARLDAHGKDIEKNTDALKAHEDKEFQFSLGLVLTFVAAVVAGIMAFFKKG